MKKILWAAVAALGLMQTADAQTVDNPKLFFNIAPDILLPTKLKLTALNLEPHEMQCQIYVQAELKQEGDPTARYPLFLPEVTMLVRPKGQASDAMLIGEQALIQEGIPGVSYASAKVLSFECVKIIPGDGWAAKLADGYEYFLSYYASKSERGALLNPISGAKTSLFGKDMDKIGDVLFSATGNRFLATEASAVHVYSYPDKTKLWSRAIPYEFPLRFAKLSRDGRYIVLSTFEYYDFANFQRKTTLTVYDVNTGAEVSHMNLNNQINEYDFDISPAEDVMLLANPGDGQAVTLHSLPDLKVIATLPDTAKAKLVRFAKNGRSFAIGGHDMTKVDVYNRDSLTVSHSQSMGAEKVKAFDFSPTGNNLAIATMQGQSGSALLWDLNKLEGPRTLWQLAEVNDVSAVSFAPDGKFVAIRAFPRGPTGMTRVYWTEVLGGATQNIPIDDWQFGGRFTPPLPKAK